MSAAWLSLPLTAKNIRFAAVAFALVITLTLLFRITHVSESVSSAPYNRHTTGKISAVRQRSLQSIRNSTLGFEAILAINLPERTDHRDGLVLASAVSELDVEFVDGVHGDQILDKVLPPVHESGLTDATKGSWRAHVNAIRRVVENRWSTALILEDDVDWDIRLKTQMQDVALASDYLLRSSDDRGPIYMRDIGTHSNPNTSPYGDDWDVMWLGHCGMNLPDRPESTAVLLEDETVPEVQYQKSYDVNSESPLTGLPKHTRVVTAPFEGTCSLAYAVSQKGARQLLYSLGLRRLDSAFDLMLRDWCEGNNGHEKHACVGVLPQLFDHHRRIGPNEIDSDISAPNGETREKAYTLNVRWSVRLNMNKLLTGNTSYSDQYPDTS